MKNKRENRIGYTTGTCAAAAAKAAAMILFNGAEVSEVEVKLPTGKRVFVPAQGEVRRGTAKAFVVKDAGSDYDVTHGLEIGAEVRKLPDGRGQKTDDRRQKTEDRRGRTEEVLKCCSAAVLQCCSFDILGTGESWQQRGNIKVRGGQGIGQVTLPGLLIPVGKPAINPVPLQMIFRELSQVVPKDQSIEVTLFAPRGKELAEKTFNPKLGIIGGISILGTTGLVRPMSRESWKNALLPQIDRTKALGYQTILLTPGNIGETAAVNLGFSANAIVQTSNFVGFMLKASVQRGFTQIILLGHLGKLLKIAQGNFQTDSRYVPLRLDLLADLAQKKGLDEREAQKIRETNASELVIPLLKKRGLGVVFREIAILVSKKAVNYLWRTLQKDVAVGTVVISLSGEVIGCDESGWKLVKNTTTL